MLSKEKCEEIETCTVFRTKLDVRNAMVVNKDLYSLNQISYDFHDRDYDENCSI